MQAIRNILAPVAALLSPVLLAHHGPVTNSALYFTDELVEFEGELSEIFWRNPHTRGRLKVVDDAGEETVWEIELGSGPRAMERRGLVAEDFLGEVKIAGYVSKRGTNSLGAVHVLLPNGEEITRSDRGLRWSDVEVPNPPAVIDPAKVAAAEQAADGIFRMWGRRQGPSAEPVLAEQELTERGRELQAAYDPIADNIEVIECRQGMPDAMFDPVPMEIADHGDRITIELSEYNTLRTIYMDAATRPDPEPSDTGYSTGHWDGETLIVTTTHIDWPYYSELGTPQSDQASFLERFSTSDGGNVLHYSLTVTDPVVFNEPFTLGTTRPAVPGVEILPYECFIDWEDSAS